MIRRTAVVLIPLGLATGAAALGSIALLAVALGLAVTAAGCALLVAVAAGRLRIERTLDRREVLEGVPIRVRFGIAGIRALPVHLEARTPGGRWAVLGADGLRCTIPRPGPHVLDATPLRVRDDLGLFSRPVHAGRPEAVLVLPDPDPTVDPRGRGSLDPSGDPEPDGLRAYVRGTPMSRIHWASAARGGDLQERAYSTARDRLPLVVVDTAGAPGPDAVAWAARTAAGHVVARLRRGGCRVLLPGDRVPSVVSDPVAHWPAIHRRLASLSADVPGTTGADEPGVLCVRAAGAPPEALGAVGPLPPGVRPLDAGGHG